jgi:hypothetical protein
MLFGCGIGLLFAEDSTVHVVERAPEPNRREVLRPAEAVRDVECFFLKSRDVGCHPSERRGRRTSEIVEAPGAVNLAPQESGGYQFYFVPLDGTLKRVLPHAFGQSTQVSPDFSQLSSDVVGGYCQIALDPTLSQFRCVTTKPLPEAENKRAFWRLGTLVRGFSRITWAFSLFDSPGWLITATRSEGGEVERKSFYMDAVTGEIVER